MSYITHNRVPRLASRCTHLYMVFRVFFLAELALLPDVLLNPSSSFGDVLVLDRNEDFSVPTNPSSSSGRSHDSTGTNAELNGEETAEIGRDFMCCLDGGSTTPEVDPLASAPLSPGAAASALGSRRIPRRCLT